MYSQIPQIIIFWKDCCWLWTKWKTCLLGFQNHKSFEQFQGTQWLGNFMWNLKWWKDSCFFISRSNNQSVGHSNWKLFESFEWTHWWSMCFVFNSFWWISNIIQVNDCHISKDGTLIVSCSSDKSVRIWETQSGNCVNTHNKHTRAVCIEIQKSDFELYCWFEIFF